MTGRVRRADGENSVHSVPLTLMILFLLLLLVLLLRGIRAWGRKARKHEMPRAHDTQSVNNNLHLRRYLNIVARQKQHRHQPTSGNRETTVAYPRGHSHGQRYE